MCKLITTVEYRGEKLDLYESDLWLIKQIRELKFGTLSNVEIQNSKVVLVKKVEKKIKPDQIEYKSIQQVLM